MVHGSCGLAVVSWYMELAEIGRDHNNSHISETYCLKCAHIHGAGPLHKKLGLVYDFGINNHVFFRHAVVHTSSGKGWLAEGGEDKGASTSARVADWKKRRRT